MGHRRDYQRQSEVAAFEGDQDDGAKDNKIMRQLSLRNLQHEKRFEKFPSSFRGFLAACY